MAGEHGFERERDWTQGPAKWAAVVVLGAACVLTSAWVMTGRVRIEREAVGAEARPAPATAPAPMTIAAPVEPPTAPALEAAGEALGPNIEPASEPSAEIAPASGPTEAADANPKATPSVARRININTATAAELELLPGVGAKLAERIIEHRRAHGAFKRVEDLDAVSGIGPRILERLRGMVTVE